jgi:hypothetical protein
VCCFPFDRVVILCNVVCCVLPLPPGKNPFAVKINNNNNNKHYQGDKIEEDEMGLTCGRQRGNEYKKLTVKSEGKKQTGNIVVDGMTLLKRI